ncbi:hypothetical protein Pfo_022523 [Paulownia fortunei]|nr:hypothetical protein Pfo_022523 [Paulownia fortunei]
MGSLGATGNGGIRGTGPFHDNIRRRRNKKRNTSYRESKPSTSVDSSGGGAYRIPLKQAVTAAASSATVCTTVFELTVPCSYAWYQYLDHCMPKQNVQNLMMKFLPTPFSGFTKSIVLGPTVIAVVLAWSNLWLGKLSELPNKYKKDALPTLFTGKILISVLQFWIPVSILNFWYMVPLQTRAAFMSIESIFWNLYLSSTMRGDLCCKISIHDPTCESLSIRYSSLKLSLKIMLCRCDVGPYFTNL